MQTVFSFLLRVVLVIAGVLFAASMLIVMALLLAVWGVRALWARLTGRPLSPFETRLDPRTGFRYVYRRGSQRSAQAPDADVPTPRAPFGRQLADVTDVEPKTTR
jgi:hypothetical protein